MPSPLTDACGHPCVYANRSSIAHVRPKPPPSNIRVTVLASRTQLPSRMFLTQASVTRSADFSPKRSLDERPQHLRCFLRIRSHSILLNRAQIIMPPTTLGDGWMPYGGLRMTLQQKADAIRVLREGFVAAGRDPATLDIC